ncbi:MAG: DUF4139 domain-containing protein [Armatimonadetes bacterium]|nr:DUF4139 domain-containing protein [Armatimonadota bacterium]
MQKRMIGLSASVVIGVVCLAGAGCSLGEAKAKANEPVVNREGVELTVYAQDFAMVREVRPMELSEGTNRLQLLHVSKQLDPQSVLLRWQDGAAGLPEIVAHSYDLGVADSAGLLKRYLGEEVEIVRYGQNGREAQRQKGRLMVGEEGDVVVQIDGKFYVDPPGTIVAPANGDVVTIPQLSVQVESGSEQRADLEVAYLTRGLSWSADYVATLSPGEDSISLECWATVTNRTGVDYPDAKVTLIAGSPNRAAQSVIVTNLRAKTRDYARAYDASINGVYAEAPATLPSLKAEPVGDFHAYHIESPTTVVQEQMNRLVILKATDVPVIKDYSTRLPRLTAYDYDYEWGRGDFPVRGTVQLAVTFFNREDDGLGLPLARGAIRFYEPDSSGSLRYVGAASIQNTPKDQKVYLTLANAFDLFTEARVVKKQKISKRTMRKEIEVVLHNEKAEAVDLRVVQGFSGRWKIINESHEHKNLDASNAQWTVNVPAGGEVTLKYTVDLTG